MLFSKTRVVDFSENTLPNNSLAFPMGLTEILKRMLPKEGDAEDINDGNPTAEIKKPKLEELKLPESVDDGTIREILQKFQDIH